MVKDIQLSYNNVPVTMTC